MLARIGIELTASTCRIVELEAAARWSREASETRVVSFVAIPIDDPELRVRLESLRGRHATVVVWTAHEQHRQVLVAGGPYDRMRAEARAALGTAADTPLLCDIAPASAFAAAAERRSVMIEAVSRTEVVEALRSVDAAGIKVDALLTPAAALTSLARLRRQPDAAPTLEAYISLDDTASAFALVSDGLLLAARSVPWGYVENSGGHRFVRSREELAVRLASDLSVCLTSARFGAMPLSQVVICGSLPELRSMSLSLMERLDVEVEPLDSLFSIDTARLPEPADSFREHAAAFRLAWAAAVDRRPLLDLLRLQKRQATRSNFSRAAVAAGIVVGLGGGWALERQWQSRVSAPAPAAVQAKARVAAVPAATAPRPAPTTGAPAPVAIARASPSAAIAPPPGAAASPTTVAIAPTRASAPADAERILPRLSSTPPRPTEPIIAAQTPAPDAVLPVTARAQPLAPLTIDANAAAVLRAVGDLNAMASRRPEPAAPPRAASPPPKPSVSSALLAPPARAALEPPTRPRPEPLASNLAQGGARPASPPVARPAPPAPTRGSMEPAPEPAAGAAVSPARAGSAPIAPVPRQPAPAPPAEPPPLPFDAVLGTILYGPERKLAIVDGRIVQTGDDVRGARIVEITPTAVFLRDAQGRLRRLTAGASGQ